jgi:hypothetical protein
MNIASQRGSKHSHVESTLDPETTSMKLVARWGEHCCA